MEARVLSFAFASPVGQGGEAGLPASTLPSDTSLTGSMHLLWGFPAQGLEVSSIWEGTQHLRILIQLTLPQQLTRD